MDAKRLPEPELFTHCATVRGVRIDVKVECHPHPSRRDPKTWDTFSIMFTPTDDPELKHYDVVKSVEANRLKDELEVILKRDVPQLRGLTIEASNERYWKRGGFNDYRSELVLQLPPRVALLPRHREDAARATNEDRHRVLEAIGNRLDMLLKRHGPLAPSMALRNIEKEESNALAWEAMALSDEYEAAPRWARRELDKKIGEFAERAMSIKSATGRAYYAQWPDGNHNEQTNGHHRKVSHER